MSASLEQACRWIDELLNELRLPGVSKGTFMGRPSLIHRGKSIIGSKDGENLVVHCPLDIKELLIRAEPGTYFETDHYRGYPAVLIRPAMIGKADIRRRIVVAWRMSATRQQLADYEKRSP
jgi:hypothetical protein